MSDLTREEMKAVVDAAEARGDTKIVRLEGKIDTLTATIGVKFDSLSADIAKSRLETSESRNIVIATIIASAFAVAGLLVVMATYGDALFGRGMDVHKVIQDTVHEVQEQAAKAPPAKP
jgi:hypothetical protein